MAFYKRNLLFGRLTYERIENIINIILVIY